LGEVLAAWLGFGQINHAGTLRLPEGSVNALKLRTRSRAHNGAQPLWR